jgi:hypothetical protein
VTADRVARRARRALGALVLAFTGLPLHRLLVPERAGPAGASTVVTADLAMDLVWAGSLVVLGMAVVLTVLVPAGAVTAGLERARRVLAAPSTGAFALGLGLLALGLGVAASLGVHRGMPRLLDEMAQLLHARYFAAGVLAGPLPYPEAARLIQNSLVTPSGWASVYPPGHTALLALGLAAGVPWLVGPMLLSIVPPLLLLSLGRLFPHRPAICRLAALLVALSPFLIFLGSGYLSHVSAVAAASVIFYAALRAWEGRAAWAVLAGAAVGVMVTSRPWMGLVLGTYLSAGVWVASWWRDGRPAGWLARRLALAALGGLPFAVCLFAYNLRLFGGATRLGYGVAFGPRHGLGFHPDPWGNLYGLREAVGYTAADLGTLGLHLLETPLSTATLVGVLLMVAPRLAQGTRLLVGWALVPVFANAAYWHHGQHMGPRMLVEAAPAWIALATLGIATLAEAGRDPGTAGRDARCPPARTRASRAAIWVGVLALVGGVVLLPARFGGYTWAPDQLAQTALPATAVRGPLLVFAHGTWANRVASTLAASGMRRDSVESGLRRNDLCALHEYATARTAGQGRLPPLDLSALPGTPAHLLPTPLSPGDVARLDPSRALSLSCLREVVSDRLGVVELAPLLWQTALPGEAGGALVVRDLGPERNAPLLAAYPDRIPVLLVPQQPGDPPELLDYQGGMLLLWGVDETGQPALAGERQSPESTDGP